MNGDLKARRTACYARVSTAEQNTDNQLNALRAFAAARHWMVTEFVPCPCVVAGAGYAEYYTAPETHWIDLK